MKLMLIVLVALPLAAQVNQAIPVPSNKIVDLETTPRLPQSNAWRRDLQGGETPGRALYHWSVATVVAGSAADALSSWSGREANPVLAGPGAQFGVGSVALKSGLVGASLLLQHVALHHRPGLYKRLAWMNFATSGVLGGVAAHNAGVR